MKYSSTLLKRYITVDDTIENIAQNLTLKSCEIEEIITRTIPSQVVIARVTHLEQHPQADKLNVATLDCGEKGTFQIICGGTNLAQDMYVAAALPGTHLPAITMDIAEREMRGVLSQGMICAKEELGIAEDTEHHWIWDLSQDLEVHETHIGKSLQEIFPRLENSIIDVDNKTLTNRPDLTGHWGMATELQAIYTQPTTTGNIKFNTIENYRKDIVHVNILETIQQSPKGSKNITVETPGCRSYISADIPNITIQPSSFYTRLQLLDLGQESKNNWIDFAHMFMVTSGQPIHFFDADKVQGDITVRNAQDGEEFTDLTNKNHILTTNDIVVCDAEKILAL